MLNICWTIDPNSAEPLYLQLYQQLKNDIITQALPAESKLPSIRDLAQALTVSKTTVESAYQQLEMEGYIYARRKVGYFACDLSRSSWHHDAPAPLPEMARPETSAIRYDFSNDSIDPDSFDFALWRKYVSQTLSADTSRFFDYGDPMGAYELRYELAKYLHQSRQVNCTPEQIIIGAGTQVLLNLLCGLIKQDYHSIGFEEPGFAYGRYVFQDQGFAITPIPLEEDGLSLTHLKASQLNLVYVSPSNQFPTGAVMPIQKRLALLEWIQNRDGLIIEDDYDSELRYFGRPIPSMQGLDGGHSVVYVGSFSKLLLPALRISYMVLPPKLMPVLQQKIAFYNQTASLVEQLTVAHFMADGQLHKQIRKTRKIYARKNQLLLEQLQKVMGDKIRILGKETGLHVLLEVLTDQDSQTLTRLAASIGISVTPLSDYTYESQASSAYPLVIMGYGGIHLEQIAPAVRMLNQVWFG